MKVSRKGKCTVSSEEGEEGSDDGEKSEDRELPDFATIHGECLTH